MKHGERQGRPFPGPDAPSWPWMRWGRWLIANPLRWMHRLELIDAHLVPAGAAVFAGNHVSYLDPCLLWGAAPQGPIHFVGKQELFDHPFLAWGLDNFGAFPVKRGAADRQMLTRCSKLLENGEQIAIFPEGTRGRDRDDLDSLGEAGEGAAFIAMRSHAPIVPFGIAGTELSMPPGAHFPRFPKVVIAFGNPIYPDDFEGSRSEIMDAMTRATMQEVGRLRARARDARKKGGAR